MKKKVALLMAVCVTALAVGGCGGSSSSGSSGAAASSSSKAESTVEESAAASEAASAAASEATSEGAASGEKQKLIVANWKGYGADEDFGAPRFEELYNCEVEFVYFNSLEELLSMLQTGGSDEIDVALPSNTYTQIFRNNDLLAEVDTSKISCYDDLMEAYRNIPEATGDNGEVYGLPWTWGTTSLGYNSDAVDEEITSWDSLWDEKYAGKVAFFDDYVTAIMVGAIHCGMDASDPDSVDLDVVKQDLLALKPNVRTFWASYDDYLNPYVSQEIVIGNMWAGTATSLANSGAACKFVYPPEGTVGYVDEWVIFKDTDCYDLACQWLDFMCGEEFQYNFATVEGNAHNTVNNVVYDRLTDEQKALTWALDLPDKVYMQPVLSNEQMEAWSEAWNEVKAG